MSDETVQFLSVIAQRRRQTMLPGLLAAVRRRRHRRQVVRTSIALLFGVALGLWQPWRTGELPSAPKTGVEVATWTAVADDPTVLQRCEVVSTVRPEWFVDDAGLQDLLAGAARESGLTRIAGRVFVSPSAIDRWDVETP